MGVNIPQNELQRLEALFALNITDDEDEIYTTIAKLAALVMQTPMAAVSFLEADYSYAKAVYGGIPGKAEREHAFCAHTILETDKPLVVKDATKDVRFSANPFVVGEPKIRFYCGVPLVTNDSISIGTLCVTDIVVRKQPTAEQLDYLRDLSKLIIKHLEMRKFIVEIHEQFQNLSRLPIEPEYKEEIATLYQELDDKCDEMLQKIKARKKKKYQ